MPRNVVICCDGTNSQFGVLNTNVVRMSQVLVRDADAQIVYYDPGIGTLPEPGFVTGVGKRLSVVRDLMFGTDLMDKVATAYTHLMEVWQPGDRVYLLGFSRGAYTVRVLAGLLHNIGLLPAGNTQLIPYALRLFGSLRKDTVGFYWNVIKDFRWTFARPVPDDPDRHFRVHFLGAWDTVSSVGWIWNPGKYPNTAHNPSIKLIRHAISIDERRWLFRQNQVEPDQDPTVQDVKERWFAGFHSDIGGGEPEADGGLWRVTFDWMVAEARAAGLLMDDARLKTVLSKSPVPAEPWGEPQHESLRGAWWIGELVPKLVYQADSRRRVPKLGLGGHRYVRDGSMLDRSVLERLRHRPYTPPNLSSAFIAQVKALASVPDALAYSSAGAVAVSAAPLPRGAGVT